MNLHLKAIVIFIFYLFADSFNVQPVNKLDGIINEFSSVSRFITGIAIQNTLEDNPKSVNTIIAELLNIPSESLLNQLKVARPDIPGYELADFVEAVGKIPYLKTTDLIGFIKGMQLLEEMKQNTTIFQKDKVKDPSDAFEKSFKDLKMNVFTTDTKETVLTTLEKLVHLTTEVFIIKGGDGVRALLTKLSTINDVTDILKQMKTFKSEAAEFFKLLNMTKMLKEIHLFANHSKNYVENIDLLKTMHTQVDNAKSDISGMDGLKDQPVATIGQELGLVMNVFRQLVTTDSIQKTFKSGFLNGYNDILLIQMDTKNSILLKLLSGGKSMEEIVNSLTLLEPFHETMQKLDISWKETSDNVTILVDYSEVQRILTDASTKVPQLSKVHSVKYSLDNVKDCVKDLKEPTQQFEFVALEKFMKKLYDIEKRVKKLDIDIQSLISDPLYDEYIEKAKEWKDIGERYYQSDNLTELKAIFNELKQDPKIDGFTQMIHKLGVITSNGTDIKHKIEVGQSWSLFSNLLKLHNDTGLPKALRCLETAQYNSNDIIQLLTLRKEMENAKGKVVMMSTVSDHLLKLYAVIFNFERVQAAVNGTKDTPSGPNKLKFKDGVRNADDLGKGIQSLIDLNNIYKAKEKVKKVLTLDESVHQAVQSIDPKWDESRRTQLESTVTSLTKLESFAGKLKKSHFKEFWRIFDAGWKIMGIEMDSKIFNDPVGVQMENSNDPTVKAAADDFKALSTLNLHFAKHQLNLKAASITLIPIQTFFDSYFGLDRGLISKKPDGDNVAGDKSSGEGMSGWMIALLVCGPLGGAILIAIIILLVVRCIRKRKERKRNRKNWNNRERLWMYSCFGRGDSADENLHSAVRAKSLKLVEQLCKSGHFLNCYDRDGLTPLHLAVLLQQPRIVETLVRNGADRQRKNMDSQTAEQMCTWMRNFKTVKVKDDQYPVNPTAVAEIEEIFAVLRKHNFPLNCPQQLEFEHYRIQISYDCAIFSQFVDKFPHLIHYKNNHTHIVLDTDQNSCFDVDLHFGTNTKGTSEKLLGICVVFLKAIMVSTQWGKLVYEDTNNFDKDYDCRIRVVRYNGRNYGNVDIIKSWIRGQEIPLLAGTAVYHHSNNKDHNIRMKEVLENMAENIMASPSELMKFAEKSDKSCAPYWFSDMKPLFILYDHEKKKDLRRVFGKDFLQTCQVLSTGQFFSWLLSLDYDGLKKNLEKRQKDTNWLKNRRRSYEGTF